MNCIPSGKLISNKNKNKTLSIASQKYEQRIKAAKAKPGIHFAVSNGTNDHGNGHDHMDNWSRKLSDIDNWRRDVISAMQSDANDDEESSHLYDTNWKQDSSTLTSSTILSAGETFERKLKQTRNSPGLLYDPNHINLTKSPSIPLFRSQVMVENAFPKFHHVMGKNQCFQKHIFAADDLDDDLDDVFEPSIKGNNRCIPPSPNFIDYHPNGFETYSNDTNDQYTPQMVKRPWFLPVSENETYPETFSERYLSPQTLNSKNLFPRYYQKANSLEASNTQNYQVKLRREFSNSNSKKNLHKTETNAKIILRPSNYISNNNQPVTNFQRSASLSIKRYQANSDHLNHHDNCINIPPKSNHFTNMDGQYITEIKNRPCCYDNQYRRLSINNNIPPNKHYQFISLVPTGSNEHLSSQTYQIETRPNRFVKNNSLMNLRDQQDFIPKIPIYQPLTMKLAFSSEPNLAPNFVNARPMKPFP